MLYAILPKTLMLYEVLSYDIDIYILYNILSILSIRCIHRCK